MQHTQRFGEFAAQHLRNPPPQHQQPARRHPALPQAPPRTGGLFAKTSSSCRLPWPLLLVFHMHSPAGGQGCTLLRAIRSSAIRCNAARIPAPAAARSPGASTVQALCKHICSALHVCSCPHHDMRHVRMLVHSPGRAGRWAAKEGRGPEASDGQDSSGSAT